MFPFLAREGLALEDFDGFLLHPGGSKVLTTLEGILGSPRDELRYSWQVLKDYNLPKACLKKNVLPVMEILQKGKWDLALTLQMITGCTKDH